MFFGMIHIIVELLVEYDIPLLLKEEYSADSLHRSFKEQSALSIRMEIDYA